LADSLKQRVQLLYQERYFGSNATHFAELFRVRKESNQKNAPSRSSRLFGTSEKRVKRVGALAPSENRFIPALARP